MRALVTGATGFVGTELVRSLGGAVVLSRNAERARNHFADVPIEAHDWDLMNDPAPLEAFAGVDVVFHLAGENVAARRWNAAHKRAILESRRTGTENLVKALAALGSRPPVLIAASATGYYGSRGDEVLTESSIAGDDFLADVCLAWEAEAHKAEQLGMRVAMLRTPMVLGRNQGAMAKMVPLFKLGIAGRIGNGRQWVPWIHVDDLVQMYLVAARDERYSGPINATTSEPVTNLEFTKTLGAIVNRPTILPAPYFALRIALGEMADVLVASERVIAARADKLGFAFKYPQLKLAMEACLR